MNPTETSLHDFIARHVGQVEALYRKSNLAVWAAAVTGDESAIQASAEARSAVKMVYSNGDDSRKVREFLASGALSDPLHERQLELLDQSYTINQLSAETIEDLAQREAELEGIFYNFRAKVNGVEASNNELRERLCVERDSEKRRGVWEASKAIGPLIAPRLIELVRRRNEAARGLGFTDYYALEMAHQ
jgi:peptidyl-dipeptidase A